MLTEMDEAFITIARSENEARIEMENAITVENDQGRLQLTKM